MALLPLPFDGQVRHQIALERSLGGDPALGNLTQVGQWAQQAGQLGRQRGVAHSDGGEGAFHAACHPKCGDIDDQGAAAVKKIRTQLVGAPQLQQRLVAVPTCPGQHSAGGEPTFACDKLGHRGKRFAAHFEPGRQKFFKLESAVEQAFATHAPDTPQLALCCQGHFVFQPLVNAGLTFGSAHPRLAVEGLEAIAAAFKTCGIGRSLAPNPGRCRPSQTLFPMLTPQRVGVTALGGKKRHHRIGRVAFVRHLGRGQHQLGGHRHWRCIIQIRQGPGQVQQQQQQHQQQQQRERRADGPRGPTPCAAPVPSAASRVARWGHLVA